MSKDLIIFDGKELNIMSDRITSRGLNLFLGDADSIHMSEVYLLKKKLSRKKLEFINKKITLNLNLLKIIIKKTAKQIINKISNANNIYINAEGAIHHNRLTSLILICLGLIAKEYGKKVILINFTVENMKKKYLTEFEKFDLIIPREKKSYLYLKNIINNSLLLQSYDFAWYYLNDKYHNYLLTWNKDNCNKKILFTKGVAIKDISKYNKYDFLMLDHEDITLKENFKKSIDVEKLENTDTKDISQFLDTILNYELLISGRHHTNIVAMFLGVPTLGLKSNTSKVSATMHDMLELKYGNEIPYSEINYIDFVNNEMNIKIMNNFSLIKEEIKKRVGN